MIKKIRAAFKDNVKTLDWMDEITKKAVEEKVDKNILDLLSLFSVGTSCILADRSYFKFVINI